MAAVELVGQERREALGWNWATDAITTTYGALVSTFDVRFPDWRAEMGDDEPSIEATIEDRDAGRNEWIGEWAEDAVRGELGLGYGHGADVEVAVVGWDGDTPHATVVVSMMPAGWDD